MPSSFSLSFFFPLFKFYCMNNIIKESNVECVP